MQNSRNTIVFHLNYSFALGFKIVIWGYMSIFPYITQESERFLLTEYKIHN